MLECSTIIFNGFRKKADDLTASINCGLQIESIIARSLRGNSTTCFLIATITLPRWNFCLCLLLAIARKRTTNVSDLVESAPSHLVSRSVCLYRYQSTHDDFSSAFFAICHPPKKCSFPVQQNPALFSSGALKTLNRPSALTAQARCQRIVICKMSRHGE